jgi:hypothetical protein
MKEKAGKGKRDRFRHLSNAMEYLGRKRWLHRASKGTYRRKPLPEPSARVRHEKPSAKRQMVNSRKRRRARERERLARERG